MDENEMEYGKHFRIRDIERTGFFDDPLAGPFEKWSGPPLTSAGRSNQARGGQIACSQRAGFFEQDFKRIFVGEALPELGLGPKKKKKPQAKPLGVIKPAAGAKWHSTPGDAYGCFSPHPQSFSPEALVEPRTRPPANMMTRPGAKGGPGYLDIGIGPYIPMYLGREPYDPEPKARAEPSLASPSEKRRRAFVHVCRPRAFFTENPYLPVSLGARAAGRPGRAGKSARAGYSKPAVFYLVFPRAPLGQLNGCFEPFPTYVPEPPLDKPKRRDKRQPLRPPAGPSLRSKYTESVIALVTRIACNSANFTDYTEQVYRLTS